MGDAATNLLDDNMFQQLLPKCQTCSECAQREKSWESQGKTQAKAKPRRGIERAERGREKVASKMFNRQAANHV